MMWYYGGGLSWLWMSAGMVLFWGGLVFLFVWALRSFARPGRAGDSAVEVLRARLARGEITPEEFEQTRKVLGV